MERYDVTGFTAEEIMGMLTPEMKAKGERDMERLRAVMDSLEEDNGQTAYSSMLKPCPFCGGRPWLQYWDYESGLGMEARVVCSTCHVATAHEWCSGRTSYLPTGEDVTKALVIEKAIKTWNLRV